ncbi:protein-histidine kinase [Gigaspora margarita]|uniref:Protein-histidine kinase n=1 Tax=Gigaspora margarita TaxID=4874 RepID=A0A8H4EHR0_GIGMA|nr:protein-histidine kinase [Gigaspora margarita]
MGKPTIEIWPEFPGLVKLFDSIRASGQGVYQCKEYYEQQRDGYKEETYFNNTFSPIHKLDGTVWGIMGMSTEVTQQVLNDRRLKTLGNLSLQTAGAESLESACHIIMKTLQNNKDIPYSLIYLAENHNDPKNTGSKSLIARLVATTFDEVCKEEFIHGKLKRYIPDYFPETHETIDLTNITDKFYETYIVATSTYSFLKCDCWPIHLVMKKKKNIQVLLNDDSQAILLPTKLTFCNDRNLSAILICGINPLRKLDDQYMEFYKLVLSCVNKALMRGMSIEEEKRQSKLLADLNHQKDMFFQTISHELKSIKFINILL